MELFLTKEEKESLNFWIELIEASSNDIVHDFIKGENKLFNSKNDEPVDQQQLLRFKNEIKKIEKLAFNINKKLDKN